MSKLSFERAKKIVSSFNKKTVLVVGDLILDEYIWGNVERISPEAPVPVVKVDKREYRPGGAANVANNLSSLGAKVYLIGAIGNDDKAELFLDELKKRKIDTSGIFVDKERRTIVKTRVIAQHQQVVRVDWEDTSSVKSEMVSRFTSFINNKLDKVDGLIVEDYGKGVITPDLLEDIVGIKKKKKGFIVTIDPKEDNFDLYKGATAITPNKVETENAIRHLKIKKNTLRAIKSDKLVTDSQIDFAGRELLNYLGLDALLMTLGEHGMRIFQSGKKSVHIATVAQEVFDVSGAGDTVIAAFTLSLASGADMVESAHVANYAAGIVVGKVGVSVTDQKELLNRIKNETGD